MSIHILTASVASFEARKQPVLWERKHKLAWKEKRNNEWKANAGADPRCNAHLFVSVCNFTTSDLYHWFNWAMNCSLWPSLPGPAYWQPFKGPAFWDGKNFPLPSRWALDMGGLILLSGHSVRFGTQTVNTLAASVRVNTGTGRPLQPVRQERIT